MVKKAQMAIVFIIYIVVVSKTSDPMNSVAYYVEGDAQHTVCDLQAGGYRITMDAQPQWYVTTQNGVLTFTTTGAGWLYLDMTCDLPGPVPYASGM